MADDFYCEKRKYIRFKLQARGSVTFEDGTQYDGTIRDISVGGAFLEIDGVAKERLNQTATAVIVTQLSDEERSIEAMCKIARVADDGLGLFFHAMDKYCKLDFVDILREIRNNTSN